MFRKGGMARREVYMGGGITTPRIKRMGGGMTGIMSGIVPDAGLTPRAGFQTGTPPIVGQGASLSGSSYGTRGVPIRLPATTPGVPALAPQYNTTTSRPLMERLGTYGSGVASLISGYPGSTQIQQTPNASPLQTALGVGTGLAGIYGGLTGKNPFAAVGSAVGSIFNR